MGLKISIEKIMPVGGNVSASVIEGGNTARVGIQQIIPFGATETQTHDKQVLFVEGASIYDKFVDDARKEAREQADRAKAIADGININGGTVNGNLTVSGQIISTHGTTQFKGLRAGAKNLNDRFTGTEMGWSYTGTSEHGSIVNGFPMSNNANGVLTFNTHSGEHNHQIGMSSNGNIYHRYRSGSNISDWARLYTTLNKPTPQEINAAPRYEMTFGGSVANWICIGKIARTDNAACLMISGNGDFGGRTRDNITVSMAARSNVVFVDANRFKRRNPYGEDVKLYTKDTGSAFELWMKTAAYQHSVFYTLLASQGWVDLRNGKSTTQPSGLVEVVINDIYTTANKPTLNEIESGNYRYRLTTTINDALAIMAERNGHQALMGVSQTSGEYVFGGKATSANDYQHYIRLGNNKFQYHQNGSTYDVYHTGRKPSAADVNAVGRGGAGSAAVDLNSLRTAQHYRLETNHVNGPAGEATGYAQLLHVNGGGDTHMQILGTYNTGKLFWRGFNNTAAGGSVTWHQIYHTGFKPTAADVGAVNKAGDTMSGALTVNSSLTVGSPSNQHTTTLNGVMQLRAGDYGCRITSAGDRGYFQAGNAVDIKQPHLMTISGWSAEPLTNLEVRLKSGSIWFNSDATISATVAPTGDSHLANKKYVDTKVALGGSTMTGNLTMAGKKITINDAKGTSAQFEAVDGNIKGIFRTSAGDAILGTMNGADWQGYIKVGPNSGFTYTPTGTEYKVYHQGFKPTAADVGAARADTYSGEGFRQLGGLESKVGDDYLYRYYKICEMTESRTMDTTFDIIVSADKNYPSSSGRYYVNVSRYSGNGDPQGSFHVTVNRKYGGADMIELAIKKEEGKTTVWARAKRMWGNMAVQVINRSEDGGKPTWVADGSFVLSNDPILNGTVKLNCGNTYDGDTGAVNYNFNDYFNKVHDSGARVYSPNNKPTIGDIGAAPAGYGLGGSAPKFHNVSGFFANASSGEAGYPANGAGFQSTYNTNRRAQIYVVSNGVMYSRFSLESDVIDTKTPWAAHYTTLNKPVWADVGGNNVLDMTGSYTKVAGSRWLQCASESTGIIPDAASTTGRCNIGNSSWWFKSAHIATMTMKEAHVNSLTIRQSGNKIQFMV